MTEQELLELAESVEWRERAIEILEAETDFHIGDIIGFVNEYWQNLLPDEENIKVFLFAMQYSTCEHVDETESLMNKHIKDGTIVYWKDPAGETSGYFKVDGNFDPDEDCNEDDRIIDISNMSGSQAQAYPCELFVPKTT